MSKDVDGKGTIYLTQPFDFATLSLWQQTEQATTICWDS